MHINMNTNCGILVTSCLTLFPFKGIAQSKQPNIILINIDDLGWTDMSSNGSSYYETPNIDKLRQQGVWFNEAYAGAANSAPSRACLLTGQYTPRHGMFTVGEPNRGKSSERKLIAVPNREVLEPGIQMLPQILKDAGYQTCHIGKWHVTDNPLRNGMEQNIAGNHAGHPKSYFPPYKNPNLKDGEKGEFLMDRLGNEAVKYLKQVDKTRPFFLYYATYAVHTPLQAEADLIDKYKKKVTMEAHNNPVYAAMVEAMDRNVGKVLATVREMGIEEKTLIVFTSDNGGVYKVSRQWPLRSGKGSFYEGGIRVPLIVYQKGRFEKGEIKDLPVLQFDLFPTFMELAGVDTRELLLDGKSLFPLLQNHTKGYGKRSLFWHFPAYLEGDEVDMIESGTPYFRTRPVSVVRQGDWKLIEHYETGKLELYNIRQDISEKKDLSVTNPRKAKELYELLEKWKKEVNAPEPTSLNPDYKYYKTNSDSIK